MIIKEAKYETQQIEQRICISEAVYGCDECAKEITDYPNESQRLQIKVFNSNDRHTDHHFCSWACCLKFIPKIDCDYFIDLPFLYFDEAQESPRSAKAFIDLIKRLPCTS